MMVGQAQSVVYAVCRGLILQLTDFAVDSARPEGPSESCNSSNNNNTIIIIYY